MHAIVKAAEYDAPMNVVVATIPGDGSTNEEFHFTAHLFEGIAKQGANDNCGGPATQLEAGRAWIEMIKDGTLPKPKRTVRFLWVPEISGTRAYLQKHPELGQHVVASISTDMVGANQTINHNSLHLNQTMYSIPSVINDVSRQFFEYVGETNREKLHNRRIALRLPESDRSIRPAPAIRSGSTSRSSTARAITRCISTGIRGFRRCSSATGPTPSITRATTRRPTRIRRR